MKTVHLYQNSNHMNIKNQLKIKYQSSYNNFLMYFHYPLELINLNKFLENKEIISIMGIIIMIVMRNNTMITLLKLEEIISLLMHLIN